jgi:hypothetical protein
MPVSQQEMELLSKAVDIVVARERQRLSEHDDDFWRAFQEVILAEVIQRHEELLA